MRIPKLFSDIFTKYSDLSYCIKIRLLNWLITNDALIELWTIFHGERDSVVVHWYVEVKFT